MPIPSDALILPDWPAPPQVRAVSTTRTGGVSQGPYAALNLGAHVGDDPQHVAANRARLRAALILPNEPAWLTQVHGITVADASTATHAPEADASVATTSGVVCAVMTADCLPVLLCDRAGACVAAVHAGWRGLAAGVIEATVNALPCRAQELIAWLGPAIGPAAFEVGEEVRATFVARDARAVLAFRASPNGRWLGDLYLLARQHLQALGVNAVYGGEYCTYTQPERFYSFRRNGVTGRMATLIWRVDA